MSQIQNNKRTRSNDNSMMDNDGDDDPVNVGKVLKELSTKMDGLSDQMKINITSVNDINVNLTAKIDNLELTLGNRVEAVKKEAQDNLTKFSNEVNSRFEDVTRSMGALCAENKLKIAEVANDVIDGWKEQTESRLDKLERLSLLDELVITGIPYNRNENTGDVIGDIVHALNCDLKPNDFLSIYRVLPKTSRSKSNKNAVSTPIIVRFYFEDAKQYLLSTYFRKKGLNLTDIGFKASSRIYINESLTKGNREVFNLATQAKRMRKISKFFTRRGLVFVQMADDSKALCIVNIEQLNTLLSEYEFPVTSAGTTKWSGKHSQSGAVSAGVNKTVKIANANSQMETSEETISVQLSKSSGASAVVNQTGKDVNAISQMELSTGQTSTNPPNNIVDN